MYRYLNLQYLSTLVTNGYKKEHFSAEIKMNVTSPVVFLSFYKINYKYKVQVISVPA